MIFGKGRGAQSKMQGDLPCPCAPTIILCFKRLLGEAISNVAAPFRVRLEAQAEACDYSFDSVAIVMRVNFKVVENNIQIKSHTNSSTLLIGDGDRHCREGGRSSRY